MVLFAERCDCCDAPARGLCSRCRDQLEAPVVPDLGPEIDRVVAVFSYEGIGAALVRSLKFRNRRTSIPRLVEAGVAAIGRPIDVVVPVPPDRARLRARGYDLPALVTGHVASGLRAPRASPLERIDHGSQRARTRAERVREAAFCCSSPVDGSVLLVDDVVTTGATSRACASALRRAGADKIVLFVLAVTPAVTQ